VTTARRATWAAALLLALHLGGAPARAEGVVVDDFETLGGWTTVASEGARVWTLQEPGHSGMGMHVGFDLGTGGCQDHVGLAESVDPDGRFRITCLGKVVNAP